MSVFGPPVADTTTLSGFGAGSKWAGGTLAPGGRIFGIPRDSLSVLIIDTNSRAAFCGSVNPSAYFNKL